MEEALALNDDLVITFRRFKDLQKNRKPEPFLKTELASNFIVMENPKPKNGQKSIFDQYDVNQPRNNQKPAEKKELNIFDFDDQKYDTNYSDLKQRHSKSNPSISLTRMSPAHQSTTATPFRYR